MNVVKKSICLLCVLIFSFFSVSINAADKTVLILMEPNVPPYQKAISGIVKVLKRYTTETGNPLKITTMEIKGKENVRQAKEVPDLVFTIGTDSTVYGLKSFPSSPVIFSMILDSQRFKGAVCGVSLDLTAEVQLKLLKKILPKARNVGVLYSSQKMESLIAEGVKLEESLNIKIHSYKAPSAVEAAKIMQSSIKDLDVVWLLPESSIMTVDFLPYLIKLCSEKKVPIMGFAPYLAKAGALFCYSYDYEDIGSQTGELGVRVLQGESAGSIGFVIPRKIGYVINKKVALNLNLSIPASVYNQADEIIE